MANKYTDDGEGPGRDPTTKEKRRPTSARGGYGKKILKLTLSIKQNPPMPVRTNLCEKCNRPFETRSYRAKWCPKCKREAIQLQKKQ